jgi:hypothetical protein
LKYFYALEKLLTKLIHSLEQTRGTNIIDSWKNLKSLMLKGHRHITSEFII